MARRGIISRELGNVDPPVCPGCACGKAHRKPIRSKGIKNRRNLRKSTVPGAAVSVDQLISPTPDFIPTHRGKPTTKKYIGATIFVDHYSDLTYAYVMTEMNGSSTVLTKKVFERFSKERDVIIQHYYYDNGLLDTKKFKSSIKLNSQTISYCGVNAHHQNGKAEN